MTTETDTLTGYLGIIAVAWSLSFQYPRYPCLSVFIRGKRLRLASSPSQEKAVVVAVAA
jgi:hypothetical protein